MAVAYDNVGPSASGQTATTGTTLSWSHDVLASGAGSNNVLFALVAIGSNLTDAAYTVSVTYGGSAMTQVGPYVHANNATTGFISLWKIALGSTSGTQTVAVTTGGTTSGDIDLSGGSISFSGADQTTICNSPYLAMGTADGTSSSVTVSANTSGNMIAAFQGCGSGGQAISSGTSRFIANIGSSGMGACSSSAGATAAATGSPVTVSWTQTSDGWSAMAVEVLPPFTGIHPIGNPACNTVAAASVTGTWGSGQTRTAGNLLVAAVSSAIATAPVGATANSGSWSQAVGHGIEEPNSASATVRTAIWTLTAIGNDGAPTFTSSSATAMSCTLFELNGASTTTPIDTSNVYGSGASSATLAAASFTVTTSGNVAAAGEYAVAIFAQERASAKLYFTDSGTGGYFGKFHNGEAAAAILNTYVGAALSPPSGAALNDKGQFSTDTTAFGAAIVAVFAVAPTTLGALPQPPPRPVLQHLPPRRAIVG